MKTGRTKRRWTLGGLMVLIAIAALPLAWYVHQVRELNRQRAIADAERMYVVSRIENVQRFMEEQVSREAANNRLQAEIRARLENSTTKGSPPPAVTVEQPR